MSKLLSEIDRRRTFAIISHPDAGKTTLTEKLLLWGGAIQAAGAVKARGEQRRARSDWMKIEQQRGISVTASVMSFEYDGAWFNLLDTPGHEDFSEDTYRTLTAVDSAVMVLDGAKGIETQTRKLFEVCRLRDVPIITFVNKLDRDVRDPFELIDQVAEDLALDVCPVSWPIGSGREFKGCFDLLNNRLFLMDRSAGERRDEGVLVEGLDDPNLDTLLPEDLLAKLREDVEMVRGLCPPFDLEGYQQGTLTPVFFGSAINNFGVRELLAALEQHAPRPRSQQAGARDVAPNEAKVAGFVFKVQANMDKNHRDRVAFVRLVSGHFKRGMKLTHVRAERQMAVVNPVLFLAQDRALAEEAFAGDIIGIPNHGSLRIGDTLTEGEKITFNGVPSFAPEILQRIKTDDPLKVKHLRRALEHFAEEGASQVFKPVIGSDWIIGVVGQLQFDVLIDRIKSEYGLPARIETANLATARWVDGDPKLMKKFMDENRSNVALDHDGALVFMVRNSWQLDRAHDDYPDLRFLKTREQFHNLSTAA